LNKLSPKFRKEIKRNFQPIRVIRIDSVGLDISIEVHPGTKPFRVFGNEPADCRIIVSGPEIVKPVVGIFLPSGKVQLVIVGRTGSRNLVPERPVLNRLQHTTFVARESQDRLQRVMMRGVVGPDAAGVVLEAVDDLVDDRASEVLRQPARPVHHTFQMLPFQQIGLAPVAIGLVDAVIIGVVFEGVPLDVDRSSLGVEEEALDCGTGTVLLGCKVAVVIVDVAVLEGTGGRSLVDFFEPVVGIVHIGQRCSRLGHRFPVPHLIVGEALVVCRSRIIGIGQTVQSVVGKAGRAASIGLTGDVAQPVSDIACAVYGRADGA
jgi:hypothetical protein